MRYGKEYVQQVIIADNRWIIIDPHGFRMASDASADGVIVGRSPRAACVARLDQRNTF